MVEQRLRGFADWGSRGSESELAGIEGDCLRNRPMRRGVNAGEGYWRIRRLALGPELETTVGKPGPILGTPMDGYVAEHSRSPGQKLGYARRG